MREGVDGVDHVAVGLAVEKGVGRIVFDETVDRSQLQAGVYIEQPFSEYGGLGSTYGRSECDQLPVDVAGAHRVGIGNRHPADAGPTYHLGRIGPHTAESYDQNIGVMQHGELFGPQQQFRPFKPFHKRGKQF